jgi:hypothetical protein
MFGAVVLPTKVSIALSGHAALEKKEKVFLIFLLLLVACCGKIAANYGVTVLMFHVKHNKKGSGNAPLTLLYLLDNKRL